MVSVGRPQPVLVLTARAGCAFPAEAVYAAPLVSWPTFLARSCLSKTRAHLPEELLCAMPEAHTSEGTGRSTCYAMPSADRACGRRGACGRASGDRAT
eukprot:2471868-Rhodomonas_salina.1